MHHAAKCSFHLALNRGVVSDVGITDTVREGTTMTLSCLPGFILTGSNTSTCMGTGEWEPDPRAVECIQLGKIRMYIQ